MEQETRADLWSSPLLSREISLFLLSRGGFRAEKIDDNGQTGGAEKGPGEQCSARSHHRRMRRSR